MLCAPFTQFALLSRRIRRGFAKIEYPRPVAKTHQDFGNISALSLSLSLCLPAMAPDQNG
jgi:hypothetical protein